jgi:hypothetical protein
MEKQAKIQDKEVQLEVGVIDLPKIDIRQYVGKKAKIESAKIYEGKYGLYVKVITKIVDTIGKGDKKVEIRGSKIFGLQQDENGVFGYGKDTKLGMFLSNMKAKDLKDLIGKEVTLQAQVNDNNVEFVSFI